MKLKCTDVVSSTVFYREADGDRYGDPSKPISARVAPPGYVLNEEDCNDANANVHPGATETCNGIDDNCNGLIDEGCSTTSISGFTLINAVTEKAVGELHDGDVLDLTTLPPNGLNIRANTISAHVGSVVLELSGEQTYKRVENGPPYMLFGDQSGNIYGSTLKEGEYILTATPYSAANNKGTKGTPLTIHFSVVYPAAVTQFTLINTATNQEVRELTDGDVIDLATLPNGKLNIGASTTPTQVGSVVFDLSGTQTLQHTENFAPYALYGDDTHGKYLSGSLPVGSYTLVATPYSGRKGVGATGTAHTIHFSVVDGTSTRIAPSGTEQKRLLVIEKVKASLSALPNPFTTQTTIQFSAANSGYATLDVYDQRGAKVAQLYQGQMEGGRQYQTSFANKGMAAGVYLLRLITAKEVMSHKLVLIR